jgi:hypothetical protein
VPIDGASLSGTFEVSGRARAAGQEVVIVVKDAAGAKLFESRTGIDSEAVGDFGRFSQTVNLAPHELGRGTIEVYFDSLGGEPSDSISRRVNFVEPDTVAVKVYFRLTGSDVQDACDVVQPVERAISSKGAIYRDVIGALVAGPTEAELAAGYATSLPRGVVLKSVAADADGVVRADFTSSLERGVAGSCRVIAIRAQIISTLKQFPEVRDVIISVNGSTEEVLQP